LNFLLPTALLGLVALLLPILIHLSRRSEPPRTEFAALRWLQARFQPKRQPVVQERLLLLVRLLLLSALVFFLARPIIEREQDAAPWWLLAPGLDASVLPAVPGEDTIERRWLAPGFPALTETINANSKSASPISLLRELDATLPAKARVRVWLPEQLQGLDAQRLQLSRKIDWQIVRQAAAPQAPQSLPIPRWQSSAESARDARLPYFRAAYRYWQTDADAAQALPHSNVDVAPAHGTSWLRLSDKPLPAAALDWIRAGGQVVLMPGLALPQGDMQVLWRDESGAPVLAAQAYGQGWLLQWQQALRVENLPVLERADFAERLRAHLERLPEPQRATAVSQAPSSGLPVWPVMPQALASWLMWLIAALFALERFLATRPSRQVRA
jgi:Aerotolerance regulator N-terminal